MGRLAILWQLVPIGGAQHVRATSLCSRSRCTFGLASANSHDRTGFPPPLLRPHAPSDVTVTDVDAGKTVTLNRGQTLVVNLASNPTTGYEWEVASGAGVVLTPQGEPSYTQTSRPGIAGGGGVQTFRFRGAASGQTTLELVYRRSWETGIPPVQTFTLPVVVR